MGPLTNLMVRQMILNVNTIMGPGSVGAEALPLAGLAVPEELVSVTSQAVPVLLRDPDLPLLDLVALELDDLPAAQADQVIMVGLRTFVKGDVVSQLDRVRDARIA